MQLELTQSFRSWPLESQHPDLLAVVSRNVHFISFYNCKAMKSTVKGLVVMESHSDLGFVQFDLPPENHLKARFMMET